MTRKLTTKNIIIGNVVLVAIFSIGLYTNIIKLPITKIIPSQHVADFIDDRVLMGASHNVFVGKVIEQVGSKSLGNNPETQFAVDVLLNIKGNLQGMITVNQLGGYKNGILYLVSEGDVIAPEIKNGDEMLVPGSTYLFATRYNSIENWYTFISHPGGKKLISRDNALDKTQLEVLAKSDERVNKLQEAYKNEVLLDIDVRNNNARNSYQLLNKDK